MLGSIGLLVILVFLNAVFASAEIAVISMNEKKLKILVEEKDKKAVKLWELTRHPARFLATIQVAITLAGLLSSAFAAENFAGPLVLLLLKAGVPVPERILKTAAVVVITLILAYFNLVFGELVPKRLAMKKADAMALHMAGLLTFVSRIFAPLVFLLTLSTNGILRLLGIDPEKDEKELSEEEIRMILKEGNQQGILGSQESEIIQNVFEFDDISAEQICAHRVDVIAINVDEPLEKWDEAIFENRYTYYPVYRKYKDNIIGILNIKDYLRLRERTREQAMEILREPYFIPEDMKANRLLQEMRQKRKYFAVLLDEYGGMSGVITFKNLIVELIGEYYEDEDDEKGPQKITRLSENMWGIQGDAPLDEVEKALGREFPVNAYDTFNGLIYNIMGNIPRDGEEFTCEAYGMRIHVHEVKGHRVQYATVETVSSPIET